jgi:hypothetical protein
MRTFACAIGALLVTVSTAIPAGAQTQPQQHLKPEVRREAPQQPAPLPRGNGYREQLADKLPFGSNAWWEQMRREGRLGGETP